MTRIKVDYFIESGNTIDDLVANVQLLMLEDVDGRSNGHWEPQGDILFFVDPHTKQQRYYQAMVLTDDSA